MKSSLPRGGPAPGAPLHRVGLLSLRVTFHHFPLPGGVGTSGGVPPARDVTLSRDFFSAGWCRCDVVISGRGLTGVNTAPLAHVIPLILPIAVISLMGRPSAKGPRQGRQDQPEVAPLTRRRFFAHVKLEILGPGRLRPAPEKAPCRRWPGKGSEHHASIGKWRPGILRSMMARPASKVSGSGRALRTSPVPRWREAISLGAWWPFRSPITGSLACRSTVPARNAVSPACQRKTLSAPDRGRAARAVGLGERRPAVRFFAGP